jgi:hypothetical protein
MAKGRTILFHHMKIFGLLMHTRKNKAKLKTKALVILPPNVQASMNDRDKIVIENTDQG